ncbi:membrane protein [Burkholderia lata]|uniref:Membrane protein n=2 Tax=Burkholderia lata (strain ATCC 17760 / DSM 23089 / LMG 22485 / NCIMB 9086 / R18194 / 383) TaxID=482957 RepID=A0A6P2K6Z8_BURL3|nr:membrane protein [Burkholderia lata]
MGMRNDSAKVMRFTAWSAIIGGLLAYANVGLVSMVAGSDTGMLLHGATMLSLPSETRDLFRLSMLADVFGFYLPVLVIGGYFLHVFKEELGALGYMVAFGIGLYAVLGVTGAALQLSVLDPLAQMHAGGDDATRAAAATAWATVANGTQSGLWWSEGPLVFFWAPIVANQLKKDGWHGAFLLKIVAGFFAIIFVSGFFPEFEAVTGASEIVVVLVLPVWMVWFGWQLLRRASRRAKAGAFVAG